MDFHTVDTAKMVVGEIARETQSDFGDALLFQAGLRILLPAEEREGVALPKVFTNDPPALQSAQNIVIDILTSGREATPEEKKVAYESIADAASRFGNKGLAASVRSWLTAEGFEPKQEVIEPSMKPFSPEP